MAPAQMAVEEGQQQQQQVEERVRLGPNSLAQALFLSSPAHFVIGGGAAGGGKTTVLLEDPLRFIWNTSLPDPASTYQPRIPGYTAVTFRRTRPQITNEGGLWDSSARLFGKLPHAEPIAGNLEWRWPRYGGLQCTYRFAQLHEENTKYEWQGAQLPWIGWDELTHFTKTQVFYLMSRLRAGLGVPGLMRAGCNPDPDSWVADFISWWIDQEKEVKGPGGRAVPNPHYGYPIPERAGVVRWFLNLDDQITWADHAEQLYDLVPRSIIVGGLHPRHFIKSATFIPFKATDNPDLMRNDPSYMANLLAQPIVEQLRLMWGNWLIRPVEGRIFPRDKVAIIPAPPARNVVAMLRYWDKAGSVRKGSDRSAGVKWLKVVRPETGMFEWVISDCIVGNWRTSDREALIRQTAQLDGPACAVVVEQEPGSGGLDSMMMSITTTLAGFQAMPDRPSGDLEFRSRPLAAQWQVGNISLVSAPWNEELLNEMHRFDGSPSTDVKKDDIVAAATGGFNALARGLVQSFNPDDWSTVRG